MKRIIYIIFLLVFGVIANQSTFAQNADSLLKYMDNLMSAPKDKEASIKMTLTNKSGNIKEREALMKQKGVDKKLYRYTQPEDQAGIATLSLPGDIMWLYLPDFGNPKKISLLSKSQAFTGTDFSYEDMESRSYSERYTPTLLKSDDPEIYLLELIPMSDKSKYTKIIIHQNKTNYYPVKMEFYDKHNEIFKEADYTYTKQGKYWYAKEVLMTDLKKEHSTRILMTNVKFDQGLSDDEFLVENMKPKK